jgi:transcriptional activator SPT7
MFKHTDAAQPLKGHPLRQQALFMKRLADHHLSYLADRASESASLPSFLTASFPPGIGARQGRSASAAHGLPSPGQAHAQLNDGGAKGASQMAGGEAMSMDERHERESFHISFS